MGVVVGVGVGPGFLRLGGTLLPRLIRNPDGTVTIQRLAPTWKPVLTRNPDGTVTISGSNIMQQFRVRLNEGAWAYYNEVIPYNLATVTADDAVDVEAIGAAVSLGAVVAPTLSALTLSSAAITESAATGALVGTIQGVTSGSTLSLTDDAGGLFEISDGDIVTADALDYETAQSHDVTIRETLAGASNTPRDTTLTIAVTNVQEVTLGDLSLSASSVAENASEGSTVGVVQGRTSGGSISLTDDAGGLFALSGNNLVIADTLDFETAESHEIEITETHPDAADRVTSLMITVTDVDEGGAATITLTAGAPAFIASSGGDPAQINYDVVYSALGGGSEDTLTAYLVTSDSATPPDAADIIAGSGAGIIEGISWTETAGSMDLTGFTSLSNGAGYLYLLIKEETGTAQSDILPFPATGLEFTESAQTVVFALGGQSNTVGQAPDDGGPGYPAGTLQVGRGADDGVLIAAAEPLAHWSTGAGMSWAVEFVRGYKANHPDDTVVLVPCGFNGSGFTDDEWNPGDVHYNDLVSRTNAILTANPDFVFGGLLWQQGEQDAADLSTGAAYATNLNVMLDGMATGITAWTATTPTVIGGIPVGGVERNKSVGTYVEVQNALVGVAGSRSYCSLADARYPVPMIRMIDYIHWDAWSLREMGRRFAEAYERAATNSAYVAQGPTTPINLAGAEAGAKRHWLLGTDNPDDTDLVYGGKLSTHGDVTLSRSAGYVSLPGMEGSGLFVDMLEPDDLTICVVCRRTTDKDMIPFGQMFRYSERWGPYAANGRLYTPAGGYHQSSMTQDLNSWYFFGMSLGVDDTVRFFTNRNGTPSSVDISAARNLPGSPVALALGPGLSHFIGTQTADANLDFAEAIVFDSTKTIAELTTLYNNSKSRLASRGITIA